VSAWDFEFDLSNPFPDAGPQTEAPPPLEPSTYEGAEAAPWYEYVWEGTESVRTGIETALAPLDVVTADHWITALEKVAGQPSDWVKGLDSSLAVIGKSLDAGAPDVQKIIQAGYMAERLGAKLDAFAAFSPGWLRAAAGSITEIRGLGNTLSGLGILADAGTVISPQDHGAMGDFDRGVAVFNGSLLAANMCLDEFPGVGEVVIAVTGIYLAGDFLYHHWASFRNVCNDVGHFTVHVADDIGHGVSGAWHSLTSGIESLF
jgi:hypothetical protein